jgi:hypothetical protein
LTGRLRRFAIEEEEDDDDASSAKERGGIWKARKQVGELS